VLLCGAGLVLLAATTDLVSGSVFGLVWPLALIVVGGGSCSDGGGRG
jgi:hypothetical protein